MTINIFLFEPFKIAFKEPYRPLLGLLKTKKTLLLLVIRILSASTKCALKSVHKNFFFIKINKKTSAIM